MTPTRVRGCNTAETGNIEGDSFAGQTPREGLPRPAGMPSLYFRVHRYGQGYTAQRKKCRNTACTASIQSR